MSVEASADVETTTPQRPAGLRWWKEVAYVVVFYLIYSTIRNRFGSATVDSEVAYSHARSIIDLERSIGLFVEPTIQGWFADLDWFLRFWNVFYGTFHFLVTGGALIYLYRRFPASYPRWRTTLMWTTGLALVGFALYPLMPPRLLCVCPYGAGESWGFIDTLKEVGGLWSFDSGTMQKISNQYAAMPSLHFAWSAWSFLALYPHLEHRWSRALIAVYPWCTLFAIIVTANHYWLDAVGGALVLAVGIGAATLTHRLLDRRAVHGPPPTQAVP